MHDPDPAVSGDEHYDPAPVVYIPLDPNKTDPAYKAVQHILTRAADAALLVDGQTYFVKNSSATSFQLESTIGGGVININPGGLDGGPHRFVYEGIDLGAASTAGVRKLVGDISAGSGTHQLVGGGVENFLGAPSGDRTTVASASGSGG